MENLTLFPPENGLNSEPNENEQEEQNSLKAVGTLLQDALIRLETKHSDRFSVLKERFKECPGACEDGMMYATDSEGKRFRMSCFLAHGKCPYALRQKALLKKTLFDAICSNACSIPKIHRKALESPLSSLASRAACEWNWRTKPILLLLGERGVGKSFAAALAYVRWCRDGISADTWMYPNTFVRIAEQCARELKWIHIYKLTYDREMVDTAEKSVFLVLDDVASEEATPQSKARMNYIISERYDAQAPTVLTGNLSVQAFAERYGDRIYDRISQSGMVVDCTGDSFRRRAADDGQA